MTTWLTQDDVNNYGTELIDVTQRAALHAVAPALQDLKQQGAELQRRLAIEARRNLDAAVERQIPNFREVDRDPRWHQWLREIDPLVGCPRQQILNDAIASSSADRVTAFFRTFQQAAGSIQSPAASTRARSSGGKPVYTRAQVKELYARHHRGEFAGKEAEWNRLEYDIVRASGEGRILGGTDVHGK